MKYADEFRDREKAAILIREIDKLAATIAIAKTRPINIMEVCGGHTHSIFRYGLEDMLPDAIELVHGPGCPVCVLPMGRVDDCVAIAERREVIFTTFGDAMRVPGSKKSLMQAKADGADVRMVYSTLDAIRTRTEGLAIGPGTDAESEMGPLVTAAHRDKVASYLDSAAEQGATVVADGREHPAGFAGATATGRARRKRYVATIAHQAGEIESVQPDIEIAGPARGLAAVD